MCPDDCVVDVDRVCTGLDGYRGRVLVVPKRELDIHDANERAGKTAPKGEKPKYEVMLFADGLLCSAGTYSTLREAIEVKRMVSPKRSPYIREAVGHKGAAKTEPNGKKEPQINGLTIPEYVNMIESAHEATKHSKLVFK